MPYVGIDGRLCEALLRDAEKRGERLEQTLKRILELYFGETDGRSPATRPRMWHLFRSTSFLGADNLTPTSELSHIVTSNTNIFITSSL